MSICIVYPPVCLSLTLAKEAKHESVQRIQHGPRTQNLSVSQAPTRRGDAIHSLHSNSNLQQWKPPESAAELPHLKLAVSAAVMWMSNQVSKPI